MPTGRTGMSIDERLPMEREETRRRIADVAEAIEAFFAVRPAATWDFAAPPTAHNQILAALSARTRDRLQKSISKDLVNQPVESLRTHFRET
jgi:hypothetical protein